MNNVLISVIVPVYNAEKYLKECIESVINQTVASWQLILVDDGSKDSSGDICKAYAEKDERICYIRQENAGVSAARNTGIKSATGKWVTFLDADDCLHNEAFSIVNNCEADTSMILAGYSGNIANLKTNAKALKVSSKEMKLSILDITAFKKKHTDTPMLGVYNHWSVWGRFFKTEILHSSNIRFSGDIRLGEDLLFCMEYYNHIQKVVLNSSILYFYRPNEASVSRTFQKNRVHNTILLVEYLAEKVQSEDLMRYYYRFVVNRLGKCCFDYYANAKCELNDNEKVTDLSNMCERDIIKKAIKNASYASLAPGKKDALFIAVLLFFLKRGNYKGAVKFSQKVTTKR